MDLKSKQMKKYIFLISFSIFLLFFLYNIQFIWEAVSRVFLIFIPFIYGFAIAFIFYIPMKFIENKILTKGKLNNIKLSIKRMISYFITLFLIAITIFIVSFIVIPELIITIQDLVDKLPSYLDSLKGFVESRLDDNSQYIQKLNDINIDWVSIEKTIVLFFRRSAFGWVEASFSFASSVVSIFISVVLAFIFSVYLLFQKETLLIQFKKLIFAFFPKKIGDKIIYIGDLSNDIFSSFISGQLLEALIVGVLFFIPMIIFRFPYALMISIIISISALIPMVGSLIGLVIGVFLILVVNIKMALWFIVMFFVIQQIEGNLIYPHVVGKASGLPSIWILVAVTLGASLMGVIGILLFIPTSAVVYTLLSDYVNKRLVERDIEI